MIHKFIKYCFIKIINILTSSYLCYLSFDKIFLSVNFKSLFYCAKCIKIIFFSFLANIFEDRLCKELIFLLHKSYSLSSNNKFWMKTLKQENLYIQSTCGDMASSIEQIIDETNGFLLVSWKK